MATETTTETHIVRRVKLTVTDGVALTVHTKMGVGGDALTVKQGKDGITVTGLNRDADGQPITDIVRSVSLVVDADLGTGTFTIEH